LTICIAWVLRLILEACKNGARGREDIGCPRQSGQTGI
jgi:hypothetical protein